MPKAKGSPKTGGRQIGTKDIAPSTVKAAFLDVFLNLQNVPEFSLLKWAIKDEKNLAQFYNLVTKLIPTEIGGDPANPLKIEHSAKPEDKEIIQRFMKDQK